MPMTFSARTNFICVTAAIGGFLFGFDTAVISGVIGIVKIQFALDAVMEGWMVSSGLAGCIAGVFMTGLISDRIGRKKTILAAGFMFLLSAFGCGFASTVPFLIFSRLIGGVGVGIASVISPMLISEFAPARTRGKMVSGYQLAITAGVLAAYFSNALLARNAALPGTTGWAALFLHGEVWRSMFLAMALPSVLFLFLIAQIPESPRWLFSKGLRSKAMAVLESVRSPLLARTEMQAMEAAAQREPARRNTFLPKSLRLPLMIGIVLAVLQQFSGINAIIYYGPKIFASAGIPADNALVFQVIIGAVNLVFTIVAIRAVDKYGRKGLLKTGLAGIVLSLLLVGLLFAGGHEKGILLLFLILVFIACFAFSIGPITWIIINEIFPTEYRSRAVSLCTLALWIAVFLIGQFFPWLLEKAGPAVSFWSFAGFSLINLVFCWKVVRETSGKSLEDMDAVFASPH